MRGFSRLAAVVAVTMCGAIVVAQSGSNTTKGGSSGSSAPAAKTAPNANSNTSGRVSKGMDLSGRSFTPIDPFKREHHLQPPRSNYNGGYYVGYGYPYYGGYGSYSGYSASVPYSSLNDRTATDGILANGGTFNTPETRWDTQPPASVAAPANATPMSPEATYPMAPAASTAEFNAQTHNSVTTAANPNPAILIFKDGRQQTVRNYAIFGGSVVVMESSQPRRISLLQLNLQSTMKANEEAGYDFALPAIYLKP